MAGIIAYPKDLPLKSVNAAMGDFTRGHSVMNVTRNQDRTWTVETIQ